MGLFSSSNKSFSEMTDRELIRYLEKPPFNASIADRARAVQEAMDRGLTNPRTGRPYGSTN